MFDDRKRDPALELPKELEDLGKRVELTLWAQSKLAILDRIKPSNRRDALVSELQEFLANLTFPYQPLVSRLAIAETQVNEYRKQVEVLKSELLLKPTNIVDKVIKVVDPSLPPKVIYEPSPVVPGISFFWKVWGVLSILIIGYLIIHTS